VKDGKEERKKRKREEEEKGEKNQEREKKSGRPTTKGFNPFVVVVQFSRSFSFLVFSLFPLLQALSLSLSLSVPDFDPLSICFCWALVAKAACDLLLL